MSPISDAYGKTLDTDPQMGYISIMENKGGTPMTDTTYNGWTNYETWNVALYIQNEEPVYRHAQVYGYLGYDHMIPWLEGYFNQQMTPDGVRFMDGIIDTDELDEMLKEL